MTDPATPLRLLVVDDDEVDREQILRTLDRCGLDAHLTEAPDATSALVLCKQGGFDCVLLDYHLPDMEQLDLVEKINDEATAVMVLTGHGGFAVLNEARALGVKVVMSKDSLNPHDLRQAIGDAIRNLRSQSYLV